MNIECKEVETVNEFIDAIRIRVDVFIREQGFEPGWEPDEDDKVSKHFIAVIDGEIVAAARCRETAKSEIKIERMVTKKDSRGKGIGKALLEFMLEDIREQSPKKIWLRSQVRSMKFYEKCGFKVTTKPFDMWGVPHIDLEYVGPI